MLIQANSSKHALNIQIHHLRKRTIWMRIEPLSPSRARIGKEYIHMIGRLSYFRHQPLYLAGFGAVGWNRNCACRGMFVWESVEGCAGFFAGLSFAGGYVDFGTAGLEEAECEIGWLGRDGLIGGWWGVTLMLLLGLNPAIRLLRQLLFRRGRRCS